MRCPSCEGTTTNAGICDTCSSIYRESLGDNWPTDQVGAYLRVANLQTSALIAQIAVTPRTSGPGSQRPVELPGGGVGEMIEALVKIHGWGSRRISAFLRRANVAGLPSARTIERRVKALKAASTPGER